MNRVLKILIIALTPAVAWPQSGTEPFIDYALTDREAWLDSAYFSRWFLQPEDIDPDPYEALTEKDYREVAESMGVEVAAIKAVVDIETGQKNCGFWEPGKAIINFDLSIYRKYAPKHGVNLAAAKKKYPVIFRSPDVRKYGSKQAAQYARLDAAIDLNLDSALESCFWGMFQIGGFNWAKCDCSSVDEFCKKMNNSERDQLELFAAFCRNRDLIKYIRKKDWSGFALRYNGPGYKRLRYDTKMAAAYKKYKNEEKKK